MPSCALLLLLDIARRISIFQRIELLHSTLPPPTIPFLKSILRRHHISPKFPLLTVPLHPFLHPHRPLRLRLNRMIRIPLVSPTTASPPAFPAPSPFPLAHPSHSTHSPLSIPPHEQFSSFPKKVSSSTIAKRRPDRCVCGSWKRAFCAVLVKERRWGRSGRARQEKRGMGQGSSGG